MVAALAAARSDAGLVEVRKRLAPDEPAIGMAMGDLFAVAKAHRDLPLAEVERLLDSPVYEPRLAALCVLDFQVRGRLDDDERRVRYELYLRRHDRITTWDMVDRAAPRVVGGWLAGRDPAPLHELANAAEPLRRRSAITAPLFFTRAGSAQDLANGFAVAAVLAADREPVVANAVGIYCKHAGDREPVALRRFLDEHAATMLRPALRLATERLDPAERARYR
jgi:3-methyladenine DNA glycosylase AlkD